MGCEMDNWYIYEGHENCILFTNKYNYSKNKLYYNNTKENTRNCWLGVREWISLESELTRWKLSMTDGENSDGGAWSPWNCSCAIKES